MCRMRTQIPLGLALLGLPAAAGLGCPLQAGGMPPVRPGRLVVEAGERGFRIVPAVPRAAPCCPAARPVQLGARIRLDAEMFARSNSEAGEHADAPRR